MNITQMKVKDIKPYAKNAKMHDKVQIANVAESIRQFGFAQPLVVDKDNVLIIGHCRLLAAKQLKIREVPVVKMDELTEEQVAKLRLLDNKLNESDWDIELLQAEVGELDFDGFDIDWGFDLLDAGDQGEDINTGILSEKFIIPPFSVLDARQAGWLERKGIWRKRIGDEGQARDEADLFGDHLNDYIKEEYNAISILDPVLCEIMLKWFAMPNSKCFDVFAGDTVFGFVSSTLGHTFTGIELRQEQVDFNNKATSQLNAQYICDDGRNVLNHIAEDSQDFLFSCPPYFDLEVYSDKENDASNQATYKDFYNIIDTAFANAIKCLKDNRFAVIVCGDVRDKKKGTYYGFPDDIIATFKANGMELLNELILLDPIGTARLRATKYMDYRKVAKVHQNVLVFYKGNAQQINKVFPQIGAEYEGEDMES